MSRSERTDPAGLLTAEDSAELLGVSVAWVYAESRRGWILTVNLGRYRRYRREAIEAKIRTIESPLGMTRRCA